MSDCMIQYLTASSEYIYLIQYQYYTYFANATDISIWTIFFLHISSKTTSHNLPLYRRISFIHFRLDLAISKIRFLIVTMVSLILHSKFSFESSKNCYCQCQQILKQYWKDTDYHAIYKMSLIGLQKKISRKGNIYYSYSFICI